MRVFDECELRAERLLHRDAVAEDETGGQHHDDLLHRGGERRPRLQRRVAAHRRRTLPRSHSSQLRRRQLSRLQHVQVLLPTTNYQLPTTNPSS